MGLFDVLANTVTGATQIVTGTARLVASPITGIVTGEDDHADRACDQIDEGVHKIGKDTE